MILNAVRFRLHNLQRGVSFLRDSKFRAEIKKYVQEYQKNVSRVRSTNMNTKQDLALKSLCIDKIIEEYLHSKKYHINHLGILWNPFGYAPKTAVILCYEKQPVCIEIKVKGGAIEYEDISSLKQFHRISITGLGNGKNHIRLRLLNTNGEMLKERKFYIYLENVPKMTPYPIVRQELTTKSAYKNILITGGLIEPFVFHPKGAIFHFFDKIRVAQYGFYPLEKSRFLWPVKKVGVPTFNNPHTCLLYEMDFMGRINRTYHIRKGCHHFVCELPNGNLVGISNSNQEHTEDILLEIERKTGRILRTINFEDILGKKFVDQIDWVHPNALEYNAEEDTMLICMRNIHSLVKLNWTTLEPIWILSVPELWEDTGLRDRVLQPAGEVRYSFQAHAAYEIKDFPHTKRNCRYYLIFDNHRLNRRPIMGYEEDGYSYINIYEVNEKERTVRQKKHLQITMSNVRSNARYDAKSNRIFNFSACMSHHITEYRGTIEEYDYGTDQLLNKWWIGNDFFSGYDFEWKSDDYCEPLGLTEEYRYICGEADPLEPVTIQGEESSEIAETPYFSKPYIEEEYFYFYTKDHSISALLFVGKKHNYQRDYTDTWQTKSIFKDRTYYCVVSLANLEDDTYQIKIAREGVMYNTGYYIKIGE